MRKNGAFKYIRPRTYITVAFALLLVFLAVTNYWVLSNDKIPPLHDANVCYSSSSEYYKYFARGSQFDHLNDFLGAAIFTSGIVIYSNCNTGSAFKNIQILETTFCQDQHSLYGRAYRSHDRF